MTNIRMLHALLISMCSPLIAEDLRPPVAVETGWTVQLIASEPDIVTPTGCCIDDIGRLLVIECHTHFPPETYDGPSVDRIYLFDDSNGDGVVDRQRLFYQGTRATMNLTNLGEGWIGVATRSQVIRIRDSTGDGRADEQEVLLDHRTDAEYPHNGLGGLAVGPDGWVYVGQGENFGESYELIGTDEASQKGGGEGGNVFRFRPDGSSLERVATGFWNPFGIAFDRQQRMWVAGNDPDAMPPNRLMHVVDTADFGFQFRFGRAGIHPLQSWNGEFPGTMPMAGSTGEAACGVIAFQNELLVTSWGDNRIERHSLHHEGATVRTRANVIVQGDAEFRPVGIAQASDGSVYITDWVDRSYPVHGRGRVWRLTRNSESAAKPPKLSLAELNARRLTAEQETRQSLLLEAMNSPDPFMRQAAIARIVSSEDWERLDFGQLSSPRQWVSVLAAWRWKELCDPESLQRAARTELLQRSLQHPSPKVQLSAIRWVTERRLSEFRGSIERILDQGDIPDAVFSAAIASLAYLDTGKASGRSRDPAIEQRLVNFAMDGNRMPRLRALALRTLPAESEVPGNDELFSATLNELDRSFILESIRFIAARKTGDWKNRLAMIARNTELDSESRADALAALPYDDRTTRTVVDAVLTSTDEVLRTAVERLPPIGRPDERFIPTTDTEKWLKAVGSGGNIDAGRRVFFRRQCSSCHRHSGRGARTGPDLTNLARHSTVERTLRSILNPSAEVGPLYVPWVIETKSGRTRSGLKLDRAGDDGRLRYQSSDGRVFEVALNEIASRTASSTSIMPDGLEKTMTVAELRDLVAFLTSSAE